MRDRDLQEMLSRIWEQEPDATKYGFEPHLERLVQTSYGMDLPVTASRLEGAHVSDVTDVLRRLQRRLDELLGDDSSQVHLVFDLYDEEAA